VFVFEFITGGGLAGEPLPTSLADEGERMLRALVDDLLEIGVEVWTSRDARLPPLAMPVRVLEAAPDPLQTYLRGVAAADAVWPIAPETGGVLEQLTLAAVDAGRMLLGSRPEAVTAASSKQRTAQVLAGAGIAVAPAYADAAAIPALPGPWVVKPDDGAGCLDTQRVADRRQAAAVLAAHPGAGLIAQPWIAGDALSLSLLCADGDAMVLSCNRQHLSVRDLCAQQSHEHRSSVPSPRLRGVGQGEGTAGDPRLRPKPLPFPLTPALSPDAGGEGAHSTAAAEGKLHLDGLTVAALPVDDSHRRLARAVARALPGLWGYAGVDFVRGADGPVVVEINPRLTTSYCGLRRALGSNVAAWVLALTQRGLDAAAAMPAHPALPVRLRLDSVHAPT
jgi:predicted ATP-grasp superfamily ATP-dependent carboligase